MKMIKYLRDKAMETQEFPVFSPEGNVDFYRMLDYYGMTHGIYPTCLEVKYSPATKKTEEILKISKNLELETTEWCSFELKRRHSRTISAFEVQLGKVQQVQVGWEYYPTKIESRQ